MRRFIDRARRLAAPILALLMTTPGVLVPLLDRGELHEVPAYTADDAGACSVRPHDHWICTQYSGNPHAVGPVEPMVAAAPVRRSAPPAVVDVIPHERRHSPKHSRAPPRS